MRQFPFVMILALAACSTEEIIEEEIIEEEYFEEYFEIEEFTWDEVEGEDLGTHVKRQETAKVQMKGQETHEVRVTELDYYADREDPKAGTQVIDLEDLTSGEFCSVAFVPRESAIVIDSDNASIQIVKNPDGTYTVDGTPAANGRAVVKLLEANPAFSGTSAHAMVLAYTLGQKRTNWTQLMKTSGPSGPSLFNGQQYAGQSRAETGAVCERFKDFCDCAACFKTGNFDSCKLCPQ